MLVAFRYGDFNRPFMRSFLALDYRTSQDLPRLQWERGLLVRDPMDPNGSFLVAADV